MTDGDLGRLRPIGLVRSDHHTAEHTPIQASLNPDEQARVELDTAYRDALDGLDGFSHLWLLTWLGPAGRSSTEAVEPVELRQTPFLLQGSQAELGILATRGPRRPNPIGLHLVRLVSVDIASASITFAGVDLVDATPVLDIKPWVGRFDIPFDAEPRSGWFDGVDIEPGSTPARLRPSPPP